MIYIHIHFLKHTIIIYYMVVVGCECGCGCVGVGVGTIVHR